MNRAPVVSSLLGVVGYDRELQELEVELTDGHIYRYSNVPELTYRRLLASDSLGAFYNAEIRDSFPWVQLR